MGKWKRFQWEILMDFHSAIEFSEWNFDEFFIGNQSNNEMLDYGLEEGNFGRFFVKIMEVYVNVVGIV